MSKVVPEFEDEDGIVAVLPIDHGLRRIQEEGFSSGPAVGDRLPDFQLQDVDGRVIDLHADRGESRAAVVFFRSAVW
jgi:hypothetical protein